MPAGLPIDGLFGIAAGFLAATSAALALWMAVVGPVRPRRYTDLLNENAVLAMVVNHANDGIVIQDVEGRIEWVNPAYSRMTGYSMCELAGRKPQELVMPPEDRPTQEQIDAFRYDLNSGILDDFENIRNIRKNGQFFWNQLSFAVVRQDRAGQSKVIVICRDVTEQIEREQALQAAKESVEYQATHDPLTGLANRSALTAMLDQTGARYRRNRDPFAVVMIDLDRFKPVNDTYGHAGGDAALVEVARRLRRVLREEDFVARFGGDEFVVIAPQLKYRQDAAHLGQKIQTALSLPIAWNGQNFTLGASIGIAIAGQEAGQKEGHATAMLMAADRALYRAKESGRGGVEVISMADEDIGQPTKLATKGSSTKTGHAKASTFPQP